MFGDDGDRVTFLRTLGETCERAGFRIHAYVLMTNHYHLLLETPEANLWRGMVAERLHATDQHPAPTLGACLLGTIQIDSRGARSVLLGTDGLHSSQSGSSRDGQGGERFGKLSLEQRKALSHCGEIATGLAGDEHRIFGVWIQ